MDQQRLSYASVLGTKLICFTIVSFALISTFLGYFFIEVQAFEWLHDFSRQHEDWELDELILVTCSIVIALSFSALFTSVVLGKRLLEMAESRVMQERQRTHGQKLQAMGSLIGGLSHSLNNYLLPILTISRYVKEDLPQDSELYQDVSKITEAAESAKSTLRRVLNFTRQEENLTDHACIVSDTVNNTLDLAETAIPSSIVFDRDVEPLSLLIPISRVNLEIILLNLISNAVDAIQEKSLVTGHIHIGLCRFDPDNKPNPGDPDKVCIRIRDDGIGMTNEQKQRIFDPFYTTKETGKGTGLGLSESYGIVNAADGLIEVDSERNAFTEIRLILPVSNED